MARSSHYKKTLFQIIAAASLAGLFLALFLALGRRLFSRRKDD